ncbi:hypothetical protein HHI36_013734 [Cryptolaemus montrouzieri]|uniref:Uncharacterized protein n=1 Tax=Cryptolaemus montrouzieri TaxID=559131 RepID=A0ABD2NJD5_9CUCU
MALEDRVYFVEPLRHHHANKDGHFLHVIYERRRKRHVENVPCGVSYNWQIAWKENLRSRIISRGHKDSKRDNESVKNIDRYLELLVVCDKNSSTIINVFTMLRHMF